MALQETNKINKKSNSESFKTSFGGKAVTTSNKKPLVNTQILRKSKKIKGIVITFASKSDNPQSKMELEQSSKSKFLTQCLKTLIYTVVILGIISIKVQNAFATPKTPSADLNSPVTRVTNQNSEENSGALELSRKENGQMQIVRDYINNVTYINVYLQPRSSIAESAYNTAVKTKEMLNAAININRELIKGKKAAILDASIDAAVVAKVNILGNLNFDWQYIALVKDVEKLVPDLQDIIYEGYLAKKIAIALNCDSTQAQLRARDMQSLVREKGFNLAAAIKDYVFVKDDLSLDIARQVAANADKQATNNQVFKDICIQKANYQLLLNIKNNSSLEECVLLARKEKLKAFLDGRIAVRKAAILAAFDAQKVAVNAGYTSEQVTQETLKAAECRTLQALETVSMNSTGSGYLQTLQTAVETNLSPANIKILMAVIKTDPSIIAGTSLEASISLETKLDQLLALVHLLMFVN